VRKRLHLGQNPLERSVDTQQFGHSRRISYCRDSRG
jgi:hypothetical protein